MNETLDSFKTWLSEYLEGRPAKTIVRLLDTLANAKKDFRHEYEKAKSEIARDNLKNEFFLCPISGFVMEDPVIVVPEDDYTECHTYDRSSIEQHMETKRKQNAVARDPLNNKKIRCLLTNVTMRKAIEEAIENEKIKWI